MGTVSSSGNNIKHSEINKIIELLETLKYGSLTVIVQDGKVIQIEKNEKVRLI